MSMEMIFAAIGFVIVLWFSVGLLWFLFGMHIIIPPAPWHPPLAVKAQAVVVISFTIPWLFLTTGGVPKGAIMAPDNMPPDEQERFDQWRRDNCQCDGCKKRRGEQ